MARKKHPRLIRWSISFRIKPLFWLTWIFVVTIFVGWALWGEGGFKTARRLRSMRLAIERQNITLAKDNKRLKEKISLLQHDPSFLEWVARKKLGMIGEDEIVFIFKD